MIPSVNELYRQAARLGVALDISAETFVMTTTTGHGVMGPFANETELLKAVKRELNRESEKQFIERKRRGLKREEQLYSNVLNEGCWQQK